jgi:hypothetical protein
MPDDTWLDAPVIRPLVDELLAAIMSQYRIDANEASQIVRKSLSANRRLADAAGATDTPEKLRRTRAFKDAAAEAKRRVYHELRRYHGGESLAKLVRESEAHGFAASPDGGESLTRRIAEAHASTRERLPHEAVFYDAVAAALGESRTVLDVGCGVQPLRFPFTRLPRLAKYAAIDSQAKDIAAVARFAAAMTSPSLRVWQYGLQDGWLPVLARAGLEMFDAALFLKFVPVIARQDRPLLAVLRDTPARRWIVTGSVNSLAKRTSIERRERGVIERFLAFAGRRVVSRFLAGDEFGYVAE